MNPGNRLFRKAACALLLALAAAPAITRQQQPINPAVEPFNSSANPRSAARVLNRLRDGAQVSGNFRTRPGLRSKTHKTANTNPTRKPT